MRTVILSALLVLSTGAFAQTPQEDDAAMAKLQPLRASIYGTPLNGARELQPALAGKGETEGDQIFRAAMRSVRMGESFQVTVQTAQGVPVTSDPRTKYAAIGCLIVSASGFVTVAENIIPCRTGMLSELWVSMIDANNQSQAWNRYYFVITE